MIQAETMLDVADNSGAKIVKCFKVLGGTRRRYAGIGDIVVCSVRKAIPSSDVKPGQVVKGVIVRTRKAVEVPPPESYEFRRTPKQPTIRSWMTRWLLS